MSSANKNLSTFNSDEIPSAESFRFAILVSEWNPEITDALCRGAVETLIACKAKKENIEVIKVPGSFELSGGAAIAASTSRYDAIICIGCIIQGETRHFEFIAQAVAQGITDVSIKFMLPVIFGVLTTDTLQQALDRAGGKLGNKGVEAALAAIKMIELKKKTKNNL